VDVTSTIFRRNNPGLTKINLIREGTCGRIFPASPCRQPSPLFTEK
jgi:hypothetical protein